MLRALFVLLVAAVTFASPNAQAGALAKLAKFTVGPIVTAAVVTGVAGTACAMSETCSDAVRDGRNYLIEKARERLGNAATQRCMMHATCLAAISAAGSVKDAVAIVDRFFNEQAAEPAEADGDTSNEPKAWAGVIDEKGVTHILDGDEKGGGHFYGTGKPGKSEFPADWSRDKVLEEVADVLKDPKSQEITQTDGRKRVDGTREGIDIRVIYDPKGKRVVTAFPTNTPRNPW